jgi:hypothetical protein
MQEQHLFEYAVIRVVPRVEREEFINTGVILYCPKQKFLRTIFTLDNSRLLALYNDLDVNEIEAYLSVFEQICAGAPHGGPIGKLDMPSRFRWLTATRSTVVQASKVHPGLCNNAGETIERLFQQLVL